MIDNEIISYILKFLTGKDVFNKPDGIAYTSVPSMTSSEVVIIPSDFFNDEVYGTPKSLPKLPLQELNGLPVLFGDPEISHEGTKTIIHADLIASTYFLITRYEEIVRRDCRDKHGRFIGKESLPYRGGFLNQPVVDQYSAFLKDLLSCDQVSESKDTKIILTHDIDIPYNKYSLFSAAVCCLKDLIKKREKPFAYFQNVFGYVEQDPFYTFDRLIEMDHRIPGAESLYFVKSGGKHEPEDGPIYVFDKAFRKLYSKLLASGAHFGYHVSYSAGINSEDNIYKELENLRSVLKTPVTKSRNHYLLSREPEDMWVLIKNGITDDYTMGYADVAGFRLGTCRPVRWIDPVRMVLTNLVLHPLTMMEGALSSTCYMNLSEFESERYAKKLIDSVLSIPQSELVLLWHNQIYPNRDWELYDILTKYLREKVRN